MGDKGERTIRLFPFSSVCFQYFERCDLPLDEVENRSKMTAKMLFLFFISVYHAIYLEEMVASEVARKLALVFNIPFHQINQVYRQGPIGIHILVSDQVTRTGMPSCFSHSHWCSLLYISLQNSGKIL